MVPGLGSDLFPVPHQDVALTSVDLVWAEHRVIQIHKIGTNILTFLSLSSVTATVKSMTFRFQSKGFNSLINNAWFHSLFHGWGRSWTDEWENSLLNICLINDNGPLITACDMLQATTERANRMIFQASCSASRSVAPQICTRAGRGAQCSTMATRWAITSNPWGQQAVATPKRPLIALQWMADLYLYFTAINNTMIQFVTTHTRGEGHF